MPATKNRSGDIAAILADLQKIGFKSQDIQNIQQQLQTLTDSEISQLRQQLDNAAGMFAGTIFSGPANAVGGFLNFLWDATPLGPAIPAPFVGPGNQQGAVWAPGPLQGLANYLQSLINAGGTLTGGLKGLNAQLGNIPQWLANLVNGGWQQVAIVIALALGGVLIIVIGLAFVLHSGGGGGGTVDVMVQGAGAGGKAA